MNNEFNTVESLMKNLIQMELFRQINKVNIAKTNKPNAIAFWKARPKSKYHCSISTEKV